MKLLLSILSLLFISQLGISQETTPTIFILGENEKNYEQLTQDYSQSLLEASHNDIKKAFNYWIEMMSAMDDYADKVRFDLKGVKVWMHVFWSADGHIDHIGYILRPDSRNVKTAELSAFFSSFTRKYKFPLKSNKNFNHYTGASFPTFVQRSN